MATVRRVVACASSSSSGQASPSQISNAAAKHHHHPCISNPTRISIRTKLGCEPRLLALCKASHPFSSLQVQGSRTLRGAAVTDLASSSAPATAQRSAEADVMGLLLKQRIVFLGHNMDDFVADCIVSQLLLLDTNDSTKDIRLFINCPGGSMSAAMAIFDGIQLCRSEVSTIAFGLAASTASLVLAGGTKGKRFSMPNTRIMVHQPMGGASGQALDVEIQAKEVMHHKDNFIRILSGITGRPIANIEKDINRDRYMSPFEALEYGLIDGVIDKDSVIALTPEKNVS